MSDSEVKEQIGKSLGRIPSGIAILTTQHGENKGVLLASWFQQCSFEPPMVTVAMKKGRTAEGILQASGKFVLNLLYTKQKDIMAHFAKGFDPGQDPFDGVETETHQLGIPVLKSCLSFLECQVRHLYDAGDHQLIVGEIINAGSQEEGQPMVHIRRNGFSY